MGDSSQTFSQCCGKSVLAGNRIIQGRSASCMSITESSANCMLIPIILNHPQVKAAPETEVTPT